MYVCQSAQVPGYVWASSSDATGFLPDWTCEPLEKPLPGASLSAWLTSWKIVRLIQGL